MVPITTPTTFKPAQILVVDDEVDIADFLAEFLIRRAGYKASIVNGGREAIAFLEATLSNDTKIDLVLLDMHMPYVDGKDVLNWIRQHPELQYNRVVMIGAATSDEEIIEVLEAGADDFIKKPYYPQELLARVKTNLRTLQLEKRLQRQSQQLAILNQVGQTVAATLETSEVLATAVQGISDLLGVHLAAILMLERGQLRYKHLRYRDKDLPVANLPSIPVEKGLTGIAFEQEAAFFLNNPYTDSRFNPSIDIPPDYNIQSIILTPLVIRGRPIGILNAFNKKDGSFSIVDLDLFASLASFIVEAIENAWLFQRIRLRQQELLDGRQTLQEQNEKLKELDKRKSEFLSTVSHELRTPLVPIKACIENMLSGMYGSINNVQRGRLELALTSVNHEARLIENLLDLVRIEEDRVSLDLETENLTKIIQNIFQVLEYDCKEKNIAFNLKVPPENFFIKLDRHKIRQVLLNLVHNAIKFTPNGGKVTLVVRRNEKCVKIDIIDTGIGVPKDKLPHIFDRFYQADNSLTRKIGGTGLGLNIAKEYVILHGGKIWVESIEEVGSIFSFTLPVSELD